MWHATHTAHKLSTTWPGTFWKGGHLFGTSQCPWNPLESSQPTLIKINAACLATRVAPEWRNKLDHTETVEVHHVCICSYVYICFLSVVFYCFCMFLLCFLNLENNGKQVSHFHTAFLATSAVSQETASSFWGQSSDIQLVQIHLRSSLGKLGLYKIRDMASM